MAELFQWQINDADEIEHHPLWGWRAQMKRANQGGPATTRPEDLALGCFRQPAAMLVGDEDDDAPEF